MSRCTFTAGISLYKASGGSSANRVISVKQGKDPARKAASHALPCKQVFAAMHSQDRHAMLLTMVSMCNIPRLVNGEESSFCLLTSTGSCDPARHPADAPQSTHNVRG